MDRRVGGALVLVAALLAALVVPRIVSPATLDGTAVAVAPSPAPVVGECLREETPSYGFTTDGQLTTSQPLTVVGCDESHAGEVVRVEPDLPAVASGRPGERLVAMIQLCTDTTRTPGVAVAGGRPGWRPDLVVEVSVVAPDARQRDAGQQWVACTAGVASGPLDRPFAELDAADLDAEHGSCAASAAGTTWAALAVDCTLPHVTETIGRRDLTDASPTEDELTAGCRDLVTRATGRPGLVDDGEVTVAARTFTVVDGVVTEVTAPLPPGTTGWATCGIHTADDRQLTASLRHIGDAPLPWGA